MESSEAENEKPEGGVKDKGMTKPGAKGKGWVAAVFPINPRTQGDKQKKE